MGALYRARSTVVRAAARSRRPHEIRAQRLPARGPFSGRGESDASSLRWSGTATFTITRPVSPRGCTPIISLAAVSAAVIVYVPRLAQLSLHSPLPSALHPLRILSSLPLTAIVHHRYPALQYTSFCLVICACVCVCDLPSSLSCPCSAWPFPLLPPVHVRVSPSPPDQPRTPARTMESSTVAAAASVKGKGKAGKDGDYSSTMVYQTPWCAGCLSRRRRRRRCRHGDASRADGRHFIAHRVEKYRPILLDDIVGNSETVERLKVIAKDGNVPHIVLSVRTHTCCPGPSRHSAGSQRDPLTLAVPSCGARCPPFSSW